jgi:catechol 2,3-dioxygenase-like lactoylglutathione lyase family enzyme
MISGAEHFSFSVSDIDAALHFFHELLGLDATPVAEVENPEVQQIVGMPGAHLRVSIVRVPGGSRIELIEYARPKGSQVDSRTCNPGAAHIAFTVDDIEKTCQELLAKGVRLVNPPVWAPGNDGTGTWGVCYVKGPDDITVELIEKGSRQ